MTSLGYYGWICADNRKKYQWNSLGLVQMSSIYNYYNSVQQLVTHFQFRFVGEGG